MSGFRGVRISKFRHIYGQSSRREQCYEGIRITTSAHDSQFCAVNPKFLAIAVDVAGGGAFQVLPLRWTGKIDYHYGRVSGHNGPVTDLKWNPFNDNVIASGSDDGTVKLWYIPDDGLCRSIKEWLCELAGHSRRVAYLEWHPTAENILASAAYDCRILLWNVTTVECMSCIDCHNDMIFSMSFNKCGSLLATTCKDRVLRIIDPRTGEVIQEGMSHEGVKSSKVVFLGDKKKLVTTGFSRASRRQLAVWDENDLSRPLLMQEVDSASGLLFPFFDPDLNILYIAGKGDGNIRYYEVADTAPFVFYLSEFQSRFPQRGLGILPKRGLDVRQCEIFRFYKLHTTQSLVEPLSFIVPRKSETFQGDLYPQTAGPTPALSADEWLCGLDRDPVLISFRAGFLPATSKPVEMKKALSEDGQDKPILVTADRNNERKFRFLSQVTKPDYREVTQREDYSTLVKEQQLKERLSQRLAQRQKVGEVGPFVDGKKGMAYSEEEMDRPPRSPPPPARSPGAASAPNFSSSNLRLVGSEHSPQKIRRISDSPVSSQRTKETTGSSGRPSSGELSPILADYGNGNVSSDEKTSEDVFPKPVKGVLAGDPSRLPKPAPRTYAPRIAENRTLTKPGSIIPGPLVSREQTAHIKPFRVSQSQPTTPRDQKFSTTSQHKESSVQDSELQRMYATQCRKVRELLEGSEAKDRRVNQLETDVIALTERLEQASAEARRNRDDLISLRHEMQWKDERIRYLEELISEQSRSPRNQPSSPESVNNESF